MTIYEKIKLIEKRQAYQLEHKDEYGKKAELIEKMLSGDNAPAGYVVGYHTPANANWSYTVEIIKLEGELFEVVERFGHVVSAAWICIFNYNEDDLVIKEVEL